MLGVQHALACYLFTVSAEPDLQDSVMLPAWGWSVRSIADRLRHFPPVSEFSLFFTIGKCITLFTTF